MAQRNSSGRFVKQSNSGNRSSNKNAATIKVLQVTSPQQLRAAEALLDKGAGSLVLIWSPTCPHCHTYMPLWKELTKMSNKQTNMISIRSDVYSESSLANKQPVESVPTVLYVNSQGKIQEVEDSRNKTRMSNIVSSGSPSEKVGMPPAMATSQMTGVEEVNIKMASGTQQPALTNIAPTVPGTKTEPSRLNILPGSVVSPSEPIPEQPVGVQYGGNLNGFIQAAGPAALLLGAYAAFGRNRSSGLPPATRRRGRGRRRSRRSRR